MTLTISLDRSGLPGSPDPLVITGARATAQAADGFWCPVGGYVRPAFLTRLTYAPDSPYHPGRMLLASTVDVGKWPLIVRTAAASAAALATQRATLTTALSQHEYDVTVTLDGVAETWTAQYSWPEWPESTHWRRVGHEDLAELLIPVRTP